jgi:hypothetical protein
LVPDAAAVVLALVVDAAAANNEPPSFVVVLLFSFCSLTKSLTSSRKNKNCSLVPHTCATSSGNNFRRFCNWATWTDSFPSFAVANSAHFVINKRASLAMPRTSGSNLLSPCSQGCFKSENSKKRRKQHDCSMRHNLLQHSMKTAANNQSLSLSFIYLVW